MKIPESLINKYNVQVPRYTSYPPANFFSEKYSPDDYIRSLEVSNYEKPENISLYIHIPFCPKMCHYCGCNSHLTKSIDKMRRYVDAIKKEIIMVKKYLDPNRKVSQVHWGGGTPNSLPVDMVEEIMGVIHDNFNFIPNPEIAIECHPAYLTPEYIHKLVMCRFNRFSLGIQDFKQDVLDNVNRDASVIPIEELVKIIRDYEGTGINLDFIYGLPFQDEISFAKTIERAVSVSPDRLVTFSYAHVPWIKKAQKILEVKGLPGAQQKLSMFSAGYDILTKNGYVPIGFDHFAKTNDELAIALNNKNLHRNFQGYCTRETTGQVYAFGTTGISQLEGAYAQNSKDTNKYVESINKGSFTIEKGYNLNRSEKIIRYVISEIMCNLYISWEKTAGLYNTSVKEIKEIINFNDSSLQEFVSDNLIKISSDGFEVTGPGKFFVRNIAANFDLNLNKAGKKFSKAL